MPVVEALIFDLDGVLVDTVGLHFQSWQMLARQHNLTLTPADLAHFKGRHRRDCVIELFAPRTLTEAEITAFLIIKNNAYLDLLHNVNPQTLLMPGVVPLIEAARQRGLKIAVASSSMNALPVLERTGLAALMDVITDGGVVSRAKPEPDIFLWTAGALRTSPANCLVLEDSEAGVAAAVRAGMYVVGIGEPANLNQAHQVLASISVLKLDDLLTLAGRLTQ